MRDIGNRAAQAANEALADRELELLKESEIDFEALRPKTTDPEVYDSLVKAVKESREANENIAQLGARIKTLGSAAIQLAKKVTTGL